MKTRFCLIVMVVACVYFSGATNFMAQSDISPELKRMRGLEMLEAVKDELKKNYYDTEFHKVDLESTYVLAKQLIKNSQTSGEIDTIIASYLLNLDDSHTYFIPDEKIGYPDYGFKMQMIGKICYVTEVTKESDAEKKGLKTGDAVYSIDRIEPTRESLWKIQYLYNVLNPKPEVSLVLQQSDKSLREIKIKTKLVKTEKAVTREDFSARLQENRKNTDKDAFVCKIIESETSVCKLNTFGILPNIIDKMMKAVGTSKNLILDLRGDGGGYEDTMKHLIGYFFDNDIKIGTLKTRKSVKELSAETQGNKVFKGKLVALIDSKSASASEVFAGLIKLEKRGIIVGDQSAGAVMRGTTVVKTLASRVAQPGAYTLNAYSVHITIADLLMSDGKSLEKIGVIPDHTVLPNGSDLASKNDPALSKAFSVLGLNISSIEAGKIFQSEK